MSEWIYQPMRQTLSEKILDYRREKDMTFFAVRSIWNGLTRLFLKLYCKISISGKENLPKDSYVLVANHSSHLDAACLLSIIPWRSLDSAFPLAAKDYFFSNLFHGLFSAIFLNALPFDRKKNPLQSLEVCSRALNSPGTILIMFPEGTRAPHGLIQSFKPGLGHLVAGTNYPVVPVYISGAYQAWPKSRYFPRPKKIRLTIGQPLNFQSVEATNEGFSKVARETENAIRQMEKDHRG